MSAPLEKPDEPEAPEPFPDPQINAFDQQVWRREQSLRFAMQMFEYKPEAIAWRHATAPMPTPEELAGRLTAMAEVFYQYLGT
jgi:hypothetical protein